MLHLSPLIILVYDNVAMELDGTHEFCSPTIGKVCVLSNKIISSETFNFLGIFVTFDSD